MAATYSLTVGGVEREILIRSCDIRPALDGPDTLSGEFFSADRSFRPGLDVEVILTRTDLSPDERIFAGFITSWRERGADGPAVDGIITSIVAEGYGGQTRRRYVTTTIPLGQTLKQALTQILGATTLAGITLSPSQADGPTLTGDLVFEDARVADALDRLVQVAIGLDAPGWYWRVDNDGYIRIVEPGGISAPWDLIEGDGSECGDVEVSDQRSENYANKVIVNGGEVFEANHVETFVGDGATQVFPLLYRVQQHRGYVVHDGIFETLGTSPATWLLDTSVVPHTLTYEPGNLPNGEVVSITFDGTLVITGMAEDVPAQAPPTGIWEYKTSVSGLASIAEADAEAAAILAERMASNRRTDYPTRRWGLAVGQTQTQVAAKRNISGSWLITEIHAIFDGARDDAHEDDSEGWLFEVTSSQSGVTKGNFRRTYRNWDQVGGAATPAPVQAAENVAGCGWDQFNGQTALKDGPDGTVTARDTFGGPNVGVEGVPALFRVVGKRSDDGHAQISIGHSISEPEDDLLFWLIHGSGTPGARDTGAFIEHEGSGDFLIAEYGGELRLKGIGTQLSPGGVTSTRNRLEGLNHLYGMQPRTQRITSTTHTIDTGVAETNITTGYIYAGSAAGTFTLPSLSAFNVFNNSFFPRLLFIKNDSPYLLTLDGNSTDTIDGWLTYPMLPGWSVVLLGWGGTGAKWQVLHAHKPPQVKTLTNSQILALPTTKVLLVPAPGSGFRIRATAAGAVSDFAAGAYGGLNASYCDLHSTTNYVLYGPIDDSSTTPAMTQMTGFLGSTTRRIADLMIPDAFATRVTGGFNYVVGSIDDRVNQENVALELEADNGGSDFTGGHADNSMAVTVHCDVEPV